jgi:hypothetical protein
MGVAQVSARERLAEGVAPYLEPGEQVQSTFTP